MADLDVTELGTEPYGLGDVTDRLRLAVGAARDRGVVTWLTENGRQVAAIVPPDLPGRDVAAFRDLLGGQS